MIRPAHIAIVGSGPSSFYTAYHLLSKNPTVKVSIFERLPFPFGLSRYGVAPDHPEVKNCQDTFSSLDPTRFKFYGNVEIGKDVSLEQLRQKYDSVVLSYGCDGDHKLGIPGEDAKNVYTSRQFVGWYNGVPQLQSLPVSLRGVKSVGIIGNGNVALDIARVLLSPADFWKKTDMTEQAISVLGESDVQEVKIIARRDFWGSKFTNKEFREMWELERFGVAGHVPAFTPRTEMSRPEVRRLEMIEQYSLPYAERTKKNYKKNGEPPVATKKWELDYMKTPLRINSNSDGAITSLTVANNSFVDGKLTANVESTIEYPLDMLITSLGYTGNPLADLGDHDIKFSKHIVNDGFGRVLNNGNAVIPGLYCSGWIKKGSSGVIASTMMDSFTVGNTILEDISHASAFKGTEIEAPEHISWSQWQQIEQHENAKGAESGKPREKLVSVEQVRGVLTPTKQASTS